MKLLVHLYTEQVASVEVEVPDGELPPHGELTRLALQRLDDSGGLEWETTSAWVDGVDRL